MKQVYETMKAVHTKGDFIGLVQKGLEELNIGFIDEEIQNMTKKQWKKIYS